MSRLGHALARSALGTCGCVLIALAFGCGDSPSPSPIAPGAQSLEQYHILGTVMDKLSHPLAGAVVTILDGPLAGTTTRTNDAGRFELRSNSSGRITLRASRHGFQTQTETAMWQPSAFDAVIGVPFWLESLEPPIGLEPGAYTLAVAVDLANARDWKERPDAPCAGFPVALASRSYRADIKETARPAYFTHSVTAEDPTLRWHDLFTFFVSGNYVGFDMEGGRGAGLYEDFPGFRYLEIGGHSKTTESAVRGGSSVSIPFAGAISYCHLKSARGVNDDCYQVPAEQIVEHHVCFFDHATLVFTKR
jgi:Carboxypeptidase regulatory-like domain